MTKQLSMFLAIALCLGFTPTLAESSMTPEIDPDEGRNHFNFTIGEDTAASTEAQDDLFMSEGGESVTDTASSAPAASKPWTYPISREILDDPLDVMRLVNVDSQLDSEYPPQDSLHELVEASVKKSKNVEMKVRTIADEALVRMFEAASADGMSLLLHSAYRSHYTQAVMHENRVKRIGKDDGVVQKPGASDHQTGLGFDVVNPTWAKEERLTTKFAETAEAQWMAEHCPEYGFIIRYPEGRTDITGIMYEPWHLRYVGVEVATYMTERELTLEEFTEEYRQAIAVYESSDPVDVVVEDVPPAGDDGVNGDVVVSTFSF
ncbi:M15 family metallopeptidase [Eubacteriales bacterium OttesenSCG-928-A19]|nr:M15 family metallopeptidase [Eubacteriales bacterium OttesenSCG-928-A19]